MIIVAGKGYVDPATRSDFLAAMKPSIERARARSGCLDYVIFADPIEPGRIDLFERWTSAEVLGLHRQATQAEAVALASRIEGAEVFEYTVDPTRE
jgi:quinol monooxygenase YgiN